MGSVSFGPEQFDGSSAAGTVVAPEDEQVEGRGEIVTQEGKMMRSSVADVMIVTEDAHVADRTRRAPGYTHVYKARNNKNNDRQEPERHIGHFICKHQIGKYHNTYQRYEEKERAECSQNGCQPVGAANRAVHDELLFVRAPCG